jgi:P-type Cu+ transporter
MSASLSIPSPVQRLVRVTGMSCASCATRIESALGKLPAVQSVSVNLATDEVLIGSATVLAPEAVVETIRAAGYDVETLSSELQIGGLSCASCVSRVEKALLKVPGVLRAAVNLATEKALVESSTPLSFATLAAAVEAAGYKASPVASTQPPALRGWDAPAWWPVAVSALLTFPLVAPIVLQLLGQHWMLDGGWQFVLATPVQFWLGWRFYRAG